MKKRRLLSLLAIMLVTSLVVVGCGGGSEPATPDEPTDSGDAGDSGDVVASGDNQIIVGNTSELSGDWGTPYWQNNASDADVMRFIDAYATTTTTLQGEFVVDENVVKEIDETDNEDGSKTITYTIHDDLTYSDGTPITAEDYVASYALWASEEMSKSGASNTSGMRLVGWRDYAFGESKEFAGVRLLDDYSFSLTIAAEELPYFYILSTTSVGPTNLQFWTDDSVTVKDDGNGVYLDGFTFEEFEDRIDKARRELPRPSSGPYELVDYDESTKVAILEINENYKGNFEGQKPSIQTVIYKTVNSETAFDELSTGMVDLLAEFSSGDEINKGLDLVESGGFDYVEYPRAGYGKLTFVCDHGPTQFVEVRQAIAHLLDRNDFAKSFTGGYGTVVNGPYGEAQWFYQETKDELNQKLDPYTYNLDKAIELLEEGGWVYDENGGDYTEGIRYKKTDDGELMPLILEWGSTEDNEVSDLLVITLQENPDLEKAGIKINQNVMTFPELLNYLYREGDDNKYKVPTYHMFNLATGFYPTYDMRNSYSMDPDILAQGLNDNYIMDEQLAELSAAVARTDFDDREGFKSKFVDFVVRWNELLPDLPLYSNIYHDFFNEKLENYETNALWDIPRALLYSNVAGH